MFAEPIEPRFYKPAFGHSKAETVPHFRYRCTCCGECVDERDVKDAVGVRTHGRGMACGPVVRECAASHDELVAWLWEASSRSSSCR
jgi:hypothetical protein